MTTFCESVKKHFQFLEVEYACKLESSVIENWGGTVIYRNNTTGIKLLYEANSAFIYVFIYKLVKGEMIDNPVILEPDSEITCFDFNDALPENEKMKPAYEYGPASLYYDDQNGLSNYIQDYALRLKEHGSALLKGDFSIISKVEKIIKKRATL